VVESQSEREAAHALSDARFIAPLPDDLSDERWLDLHRVFGERGGFDQIGPFRAWALSERSSARLLVRMNDE
jgi:hypothetical protein